MTSQLVRDPNAVLPQSVSVADFVYDQILQAVYAGRLKPGDRINDIDLADEFGVSRTPVREALQRLRELGLIEAAAARYTRVATIDEAKTQQALVVWVALYRAVIDEVVPTIGDESVARVEAFRDDFVAHRDPWDAVQLAAATFNVYDEISAQSRNPVLRRSLSSVVHLIRLGVLARDNLPDVALLTEVQDRLIEGLRARDPRLCHKAFDRLLALFGSQPARASTRRKSRAAPR